GAIQDGEVEVRDRGRDPTGDPEGHGRAQDQARWLMDDDVALPGRHPPADGEVAPEPGPGPALGPPPLESDGLHVARPSRDVGPGVPARDLDCTRVTGRCPILTT